MSSKLFLDALFPPSPDQLIVDMEAVGADGCAIYVWRPGGVGNWTPAHKVRLDAAGKLSFPIIVPLPEGGDINGMLGAVRAFGFLGGLITLDLEAPGLPPPSWEASFDAAIQAGGYTDFDYGTRSDLGLYQPDNEDWLAEWIRTGVLLPLPEAPNGSGWQFVNDIMINGSQYDASVIDSALFGGSLMLDPADIAAIANAVFVKFFDPNPGPGQYLTDIVQEIANGEKTTDHGLNARLDRIETMVKALQAPAHDHAFTGTTGPAVPTP